MTVNKKILAKKSRLSWIVTLLKNVVKEVPFYYFAMLAEVHDRYLGI
ncbi:MAG: hypothetical protein FWJ66_05185 [Caldibacillus sp.]